MCLAVPAKLVSRSEETAIADLHGNRVEISTVLVPDAIPGDWVLVHAGFAIQRLSDEEAQKTWDVLRDLKRVAQEHASSAATGGVP
jgi:hydrogenase expression/formation protein HypC